ncbi:MAG: carbon-nitrogen hydrolase family protein [Gordonia paraffinivorans]
MPPANTLRVCAAQPSLASDLASAVIDHARIVRNVDADLVVFPELSLTGYVLDAHPVDLNGPDVLADLVDACTSTGAVALVGAPVREEGRDHIATLRIDPAGVTIAYRKRHLGADEEPRFRPGPGPGLIDVHGWRVGLGICKDTGVEQHVAAMAALDLDLYACGVVHHRTEIDEQMRRATHIARRCRSYVVMASHAGPTGHGYGDTAGNSVVVDPTGTCVIRAGDAPGTTVTASLGSRSDAP